MATAEQRQRDLAIRIATEFKTVRNEIAALPTTGGDNSPPGSNETDFMSFGDGSDGDVVVNSSITLTRDMFYNNLTIQSGGKINTNYFQIFVKDTLDLSEATIASRAALSVELPFSNVRIVLHSVAARTAKSCNLTCSVAISVP